MDWIELFQMVGITSGPFIIVIVVVAYFVRSVFKIYLDKDLEKFKGELRLAATEHEIKFSKLHLDRAEIIKELYSKLIEAEDLMIEYLFRSNANEGSEDHEILVNKLFEFEKYYKTNAIYFNDEICDLLNKFWKTMHHMDINKSLSDEFRDSANRFGFIEDGKEATKLRKENWDQMFKTTIPEIKTKLRKQFQELLGV